MQRTWAMFPTPIHTHTNMQREKERQTHKTERLVSLWQIYLYFVKIFCLHLPPFLPPHLSFVASTNSSPLCFHAIHSQKHIWFVCMRKQNTRGFIGWKSLPQMPGNSSLLPEIHMVGGDSCLPKGVLWPACELWHTHDYEHPYTHTVIRYSFNVSMPYITIFHLHTCYLVTPSVTWHPHTNCRSPIYPTLWSPLLESIPGPEASTLPLGHILRLHLSSLYHHLCSHRLHLSVIV